MDCTFIIADNQSVFRTGAARLVILAEGFRIVRQCDDLGCLYKAAESSRKAIIMFANSLNPDLAQLLEKSNIGNSLLIAVLENTESADPFLKCDVEGIIYRDIPNAEMIKCLRSVAIGSNYVQQRLVGSATSFEPDTVGQQIHDRLTAKERRIVGLLAQGYKNKDIARELNNSEQVIKNHFRTIFDKTGFSDRLELALFTTQHRILFEACS